MAFEIKLKCKACNAIIWVAKTMVLIAKTTASVKVGKTVVCIRCGQIYPYGDVLYIVED